MSPKRIQRKRTKGWKMPPGTLCVGRPSKWGNPFRVFRSRGGYDVVGFSGTSLGFRHSKIEADALAVERMRWWLWNTPFGGVLITDAWRELCDHDLACWCSLDDVQGHPYPCHADLWLEIANGGK